MSLLKTFAEWEQDPEFQRGYARYKARIDFVERLTRPLRRIPLIGRTVYVFWYALFTEPSGVLDSLSFSFLNDYMFHKRGKPTLWHTWYQMTHDNDGPFAGIYVEDPPPASLAEAIALEAKYETAAWKQYVADKYKED